TVRGAQEGSAERRDGVDLSGTDLRGARAEPAVTREELVRDRDLGGRHGATVRPGHLRPAGVSRGAPCAPCRLASPGARAERRGAGNVSDLIDTTEMYLRSIYELTEEGIVRLRARIAARRGHSGPTVSQTVARMERDGLVVVAGDRHLDLTPDGLAKATRVMRKHRLAELLLTDVIGLDWAYVHDEACRWEHVMSDRVEQRILELLDRPRHSPYGNPIPG